MNNKPLKINDDKFRRCPTVYDFMVELYMLLKTNKVHSFRKAYSEFKMSDDFDCISDDVEYDVQLLNSVGQDEFYYWVESWVNHKNEHFNFELMYCFQTLREIDKNYQMIFSNRGWYELQGPLNQSSNQTVYLYNVKGDCFQKKYLENNKIRYGRQTVPYTSSEMMTFKNFMFVDRNSLSGYTPKVNFYNPNFKNSSSIKIAYAPTDKSKWFDDSHDEITGEINIKYHSNKENDFFEKYKCLIQTADENGADIIIFPELALFPGLIEKLCAYLKYCNFDYLRMIFIGSCNNNDMNESYILSSSGTLLCSYNKKHTYDEYDVEVNKYLCENIDHDDNIALLDVKGLGRISYYICRDFIFGEMTTICQTMQSDFIFVSAYSRDMITMANQAQAICSTTSSIIIICNACAAIDDKGTLTYLAKPKVDKPKQLITDVKSNNRSSFCRNNCDKCLVFYTIEF